MGYLDKNQKKEVSEAFGKLHLKGIHFKTEDFLNRLDILVNAMNAALLYHKKLDFIGKFSEIYRDALKNEIIPELVKENRNGHEVKEVGADFEAAVSLCFRFLPKEIRESIGNQNLLDLKDYGDFVKTAFLEESSPLYADFNKDVSKDGDHSINLAVALKLFMNDMKDTVLSLNDMPLATEQEVQRATNDVKKEVKEEIPLISEKYMAIRHVYNDLGFFGKWFTRKGYILRGAMNTVKDVLSEIDEKFDFASESDSISEFLHQAAADKIAVDSNYQKSLESFNPGRASISVSLEELDGYDVEHPLNNPESIFPEEKDKDNFNKESEEAMADAIAFEADLD